jgi:outer membrane protein TolC
MKHGWSVVAVLVPFGLAGQEPLHLDEVVRSALATHPTVEAGRARAAAAGFAAGEARASVWPSLGVTGLATRFQEPMVVAPLHGIDPTNPPEFERALVQGHVSAEWTVFDGGQRRSRIEGASRLAEAAEWSAAAAADVVVESAVSAYLAVLTLRTVVEAHERQLEALEAERRRAVQMYEEGRSPRVEVLRTEAALSRAVADRESSEERLWLAVQRLVRVSGLEARRVAETPLVELAPAFWAAPDRDGLVAVARSSHPAVEQASRRAAAAAQALTGARSLWLPRVSLAGRYSAYGSASTSFQPEWNVGTQVSYALFNGGARARSVDRAEAEVAIARAELAGIIREVEDGVEAALAAYRSARSRAEALEAAVAQSAEVARIEALALESGAGVQTDYLRAEAELLTVRAALAEARHGAVEARVRLERATGRLDPESLAELLVEVNP